MIPEFPCKLLNWDEKNDCGTLEDVDFLSDDEDAPFNKTKEQRFVSKLMGRDETIADYVNVLAHTKSSW